MKNKITITGIWFTALLGITGAGYLLYSSIKNKSMHMDKLVVNTDRMPKDLWLPNKSSQSLSQLGKSIYIREGCNNCHSQIAYPKTSNVENSFKWGSKRTGPSLANIGGKLSNTALLSLLSTTDRNTDKDVTVEHNHYPLLASTKLTETQGTEMDALITYIQQLKK